MTVTIERKNSGAKKKKKKQMNSEGRIFHNNSKASNYFNQNKPQLKFSEIYKAQFLGKVMNLCWMMRISTFVL
jgi:hypothetical protein